MLEQLKALLELGMLRPIDYQFAKFMDDTLDGQTDRQLRDLLILLSAWVSQELGNGHVCLLLSESIPRPALDLPAQYSESLIELLPTAQQWSGLLLSSDRVSDGSYAAPLVLEYGRLYLYRYWRYEGQVALYMAHHLKTFPLSMDHQKQLARLLERLFAINFIPLWQQLSAMRGSDKQGPLDRSMLCECLDIRDDANLNWPAIDAVLDRALSCEELEPLRQWIPDHARLDWQRLAAATVISRDFAVVSGGPGTGKTSTVVRILAALVQLHQWQGRASSPIIRLVAPTGKAAARLTESIRKAILQLPIEPQLRQQIPTEASSVHRLLGAIVDRNRFRHDRTNPLHLDVLIIDEASMMDLPLMARLLEALPSRARLILLGDRDQLASVEVGSVLGDICSFADDAYSKEQAALLSRLSGFQLSEGVLGSSPSVADSLCMLRKSYRFNVDSGIGNLARAIKSGKPVALRQVLQRDYADITHLMLGQNHYRKLIERCVEGYRTYLQSIADGKLPQLALDEFNRQRLLCVVNQGPYGVAGLNQAIEQALVRAKLIQMGGDSWYEGRPVMVTRNDHDLKLYNGDIGIALRSAADGRMRVYFEQAEDGLRAVLPNRLPEHQTSYAMTIHKSQGSEFADTLILLPPEFSPLLTRELLYTGVTRAKARLFLYANIKVLEQAVRTPTIRMSGLSDRLVQLALEFNGGSGHPEHS